MFEVRLLKVITNIYQVFLFERRYQNFLNLSLFLYRVATLPGKAWKNLEFNNLGKKKLEKPRILNKNFFNPGKTWNFY